MIRKFIFIFFIFIFTISYSAFSQDKGIRRFAILVGANDGGPARGKLRFAISDATSLMNVLTSIGSVDRGDSYLLIQPKRDMFIGAFNSIFTKINNSPDRNMKYELIFYYSGHSDEDGILLSDDKIPFVDLKKAIESIPADVRIAILDSCYSGAFTMLKGGQKKPPFMIDPGYSMKGNAFITSSSIDEVSQESDTIKGSFFTHYLILGLRGAADMTNDRKISLNEAYQYAYRETLFRTEKTAGGAQHPNYNIQMNGTGDVILTDVNRGTAKLTFAEDIEGKISLYGRQNSLIAEFSKAYGQDVTLSLEKGEYTIIHTESSGLKQANITLKDKPQSISSKDFTRTVKESTIVRGDSAPAGNNTERETLIGHEKIKVSGFASFLIKMGPPGIGHGQVFVGGKGCVLFNETFAIGAGGFGLTYPRKRDGSRYDENNPTAGSSYNYPKVNMGYGGGIIEYYLYPKSLFCFSGGMLIGAGGVTFAKRSESNDYNYDSTDNSNSTSAFFVMEPEIGIHLNVSNYVRIGASVSYRFTKGIDIYEFKDRDFRGMYVTLAASAGWF